MLTGLAPLTSAPATTTLTVPADIVHGAYFLIAVADGGNQVGAFGDLAFFPCFLKATRSWGFSFLTHFSRHKLSHHDKKVKTILNKY